MHLHPLRRIGYAELDTRVVVVVLFHFTHNTTNQKQTMNAGFVQILLMVMAIVRGTNGQIVQVSTRTSKQVTNT